MKARIVLFLESLLSRKFLIAVVGVAMFISMDEYDQALIILLAYLGVEGGADVVSRYKGGTLNTSVIENAMSQNIDSEVDTSTVVTGKASGVPLFNEETNRGE